MAAMSKGTWRELNPIWEDVKSAVAKSIISDRSVFCGSSYGSSGDAISSRFAYYQGCVAAYRMFETEMDSFLFADGYEDDEDNESEEE